MRSDDSERDREEPSATGELCRSGKVVEPLDPSAAGADLSLLPAGKAICRTGLSPAGEDEANGGHRADERTQSAIDSGERDAGGDEKDKNEEPMIQL